ncbi:response regulator transcription factor [Sulfuricurvum sp. IAE1]|jgi:DNA-binding response OmpR family regulator|uniref:response regulator transcription factor n=1 Tax=Sulfuricurvum sp. IAE1 TaxID=2546102 RepID=UPI0010463E32|nr:response regulator transcription factor [Sulfuricurvum sp. IAE1]MDD3769064.1 response regulator transcription factor [Sulfuricurvum sp.]MDX9965881.1 response regulator transcription factor [Sulfuricurvum sp.]TDA67168.1 response regulator transcription factor [Sulfuricurvum sp. IAE1]
MRAKILLLEDDPNLSESVGEYLEENGYEVVCVYDAQEAEDAMFEQKFDLLLLDVNVPGGDGFSLLKSSRADGNATPAIFITSRNAMSDLESGFESGGDDYLRKPFELKELLLRIKTILKRNFFHNPSETLDLGGGITYDIDSQTLRVGGKEQNLQLKEHKLLKLFIQHPNELLSHERIMEHLWDYDETPSDGSLRTYIKTLRKYLGKDRIVSHKRLGYQFR